MAPLRFDTSRRATATRVIALAGELDLAGAPRWSRRSRLAGGEPAAPRRARPARAGVHGLERAAADRARGAALRSADARVCARPGREHSDARVRHHAHGERLEFVDDPAERSARGAAMTFDVELPSDPDSAAQARGALDQIVRPPHRRRLRGRAAARLRARHERRSATPGRRRSRLVVALDGRAALRVEVRDPGPGFELSSRRRTTRCARRAGASTS